jgi:hypothetical protein
LIIILNCDSIITGTFLKIDGMVVITAAAAAVTVLAVYINHMDLGSIYYVARIRFHSHNSSIVILVFLVAMHTATTWINL